MDLQDDDDEEGRGHQQLGEERARRELLQPNIVQAEEETTRPISCKCVTSIACDWLVWLRSVRDRNAAPRLLYLRELERVDETEDNHAVNNDDPPEDVDADSPPRVEELQHTTRMRALHATSHAM